MTNPIKLGVIGCGKHALQSHIRVALGMPKIYRVTLLYDLNHSASEQIAMECARASGGSMRSVNDVEELFQSRDVDAILIATPPASHLDYLERAIRAEKNVICEKPIWNGTAETEWATNLIVLARERSLVLTSCHPRRFEPPYVEVKKRLPEFQKLLGTLREINFRFFYHVPPKGGWREGDSLLLDHMNHEIDLVNFLIGRGRVSFRKVFDSFDRYQVQGERLEKDGPAISFSGYRKLGQKTYRNELELVFDRGRVLTTSVLEGPYVTDWTEVTRFEQPKSSDPIQMVLRDVHVPFVGIMNNFAEVMACSGSNYLEMDDMIYNNSVANLLAQNPGITNFGL